MLSDLAVGQLVTLKTAIYLDERYKGLKSLNLILGSHHPEYSAALCITPQEMWTDPAIVDGIYAGAKA